MSREPSTNRDKLANDIWRACDIMRRDNNCGGIMDYLEHLSWVLFLKFLDEQEKAFEKEAAIARRTYNSIIDEKYRWSEWVPKAIGEKCGLRIAETLLNGMARHSCSLYAVSCCPIFRTYMVVRNAKLLLASSAVIAISLFALHPTTLKMCWKL
jgi:HsdM N-terminal domain